MRRSPLLPLLLALLLAVAATLSGCSGVERHTTGVAVEQADRFYPSLRAAAQQSGYEVYDQDDGVFVLIDEMGKLQYTPDPKGTTIDVLLVPEARDDDDDASRMERVRQLRELHLALMDRARDVSDSNRAFDVTTP